MPLFVHIDRRHKTDDASFEGWYYGSLASSRLSCHILAYKNFQFRKNSMENGKREALVQKNINFLEVSDTEFEDFGT